MSTEILNRIEKYQAQLTKLTPADYRYSYMKEMIDDLNYKLKSQHNVTIHKDPGDNSNVTLHRDKGDVCESCT